MTLGCGIEWIEIDLTFILFLGKVDHSDNTFL